jgi:hypothetical protein
MHEQYVMLRNLVTNLEFLLVAEWPMSTEDVTTRSADVQRVTRGSYSATRVIIRNFAADLGQFALVRWRALPDNGKRQLEDSINVLFLSAIENISSRAAEHDSSNGVTSDKLPPIIPRDLAKSSPREFNEVVLQQSQGLNLSGSRGLSAEEEISSLLLAKSSTPGSWRSSPTPLHSATGGSLFGQRFPKLSQFCAGIATVFPGTSTVESDFSVLNWECDEFRSSLTDFSLLRRYAVQAV